MAARNSIAIIGGGASGVILAAHLLRSSDPNLRVVLIEKKSRFGRGRAYSTDMPEHQLNVRARGMSAFAAEPDHFWNWLQQRGYAKDDPDFFAPRRLYGEYLGDILDQLTQQEEKTGRLNLLNAEVLDVLPTASGVEIRLTNGSSIVSRTAVLAAGHDEAPAPAHRHAVRMDGPGDTPFDLDRDVLALGTGLSMVDVWLSLQQRGHRGRLIAVSRRGLLPWPHGPGNPVRLDAGDVPLGTDLSYFVRWFRDLVRLTESRGGHWRDVVDGLRPFNQRIWQSWSPAARRRFLEHTKAWWDIHRHRMPPAMHARVSQAVNSGQILLIAGRVLETRPAGDGFAVRIQTRIPSSEAEFQVARIYDCSGIVKNVSEGSIGLLRSLIDRGLARPDALGIGLDVTTGCAVVDAEGKASRRLYAVGPLTRGAFFEIDAIPEIRVQCAELAERLIAQAPA